MGFRAITPVFDGATQEQIEAELARAWIVDQAWKESGQASWEWIKQQEYDPESIQDDEEVRRLYLESWLGKRKYDVSELNDVDYARHAAAHEWLRDREYDPKVILSSLDEETVHYDPEVDKQTIQRLFTPLDGKPWLF